MVSTFIGDLLRINRRRGETQDQEEIKVRKLFDEEIERCLGPSAKPDDFKDRYVIRA
jgi:hypothetical protein